MKHLTEISQNSVPIKTKEESLKLSLVLLRTAKDVSIYFSVHKYSNKLKNRIAALGYVQISSFELFYTVIIMFSVFCVYLSCLLFPAFMAEIKYFIRPLST